MANFIGRIRLPNNQLYEFHDVEFVEDARTGTSSQLTGMTSSSSLFDGMQIIYFFLREATAESGNFSLSLSLSTGSSTGLLPVYDRNGTALISEFEAGDCLHLVYRDGFTNGESSYSSGWWIVGSGLNRSQVNSMIQDALSSIGVADNNSY